LKIIVFIIVLFGLQLLFAQQFSEDIIVEGRSPIQIAKSRPAIALDSQNKLAVFWGDIT